MCSLTLRHVPLCHKDQNGKENWYLSKLRNKIRESAGIRPFIRVCGGSQYKLVQDNAATKRHPAVTFFASVGLYFCMRCALPLCSDKTACESAHVSSEPLLRLFSWRANALKDLLYKGHLRKSLHYTCQLFLKTVVTSCHLSNLVLCEAKQLCKLISSSCCTVLSIMGYWKVSAKSERGSLRYGGALGMQQRKL